MKSVNKITLLGNVTRTPELKAVPSGQSVCTFGLATNRVWKDNTGEKQSLAEFHNLVAWGGLAELCFQWVKKGKPLYVEGYLKTRSWDGADGHKQFRTEIVLEDMVLLGSRDDLPAFAASEDASAEGGEVHDASEDQDAAAPKAKRVRKEPAMAA